VSMLGTKKHSGILGAARPDETCLTSPTARNSGTLSTLLPFDVVRNAAKCLQGLGSFPAEIAFTPSPLLQSYVSHCPLVRDVGGLKA